MRKFLSHVWSEATQRIVINWGSTIVGIVTILVGLNSSDSLSTKTGIVLAGAIGVLAKNTSIR